MNLRTRGEAHFDEIVTFDAHACRIGKDAVRDALLQSAFAGKVGLLDLLDRSATDAHLAITVPVYNEAELLPRCLGALHSAIVNADMKAAVVFAVHDSDDVSFGLIREWFRVNGHAGCALELEFDRAIRDAPHARRIAMDVAAHMVPTGVLLTTDADTHVAPGWCRNMMEIASSGHDLVCEDVRLDDGELTDLPDRVRNVGEAERAYFNAVEELWVWWTEGAFGTFAHRASGASMAIRTPVYTALGGLPLPSSGEDSALCELALQSGYKVITIRDGGTRTSARMVGRADGGCGTTLALRATIDDPVCDGRLIPVANLFRKARRLNPALVMPQGAEKFARSNAFACDKAAPLRYTQVLHELAIAQGLLRQTETVDAR